MSSLPIDEAASVKEQKANPLYASRVQVYPKKIAGYFRRLKWTVLIVLLSLYYILPWIRWDRGPGAPDQAIMIDLTNERGYFFFIEIWPQEVYYLTGLLILAALGLFLATSLAGRVWCGYACPQTVWTDLFMWIERQIEGDRNARIKLDKKPLSLGKASKKISKHAAWLLIAFLTGGAWILYFGDAPTVIGEFFTGQSSTTMYFFVGLFTATTYMLAGWAREQVCTYMCPWPRFQSAMLDEDSLVVTYAKWRGEPRGKHKTGESWDDRGHCVDCRQCVAVCPTGIDIRDGIQLECIGCALCIDACNDIMGKLGLPKNLIAYDTERRQSERASGKNPTYRIFRPRTILYSMLIVAVGVFMLVTLSTRETQSINVLRDRTPLFVRLSDGSIRNGFAVKILNKARTARRFQLTLEGLPKGGMRVVGESDPLRRALPLVGKADTVTAYKIFIRAPKTSLTGADTPFKLVLTDPTSGETSVRKLLFKGPR